MGEEGREQRLHHRAVRLREAANALQRLEDGLSTLLVALAKGQFHLCAMAALWMQR